MNIFLHTQDIPSAPLYTQKLRVKGLTAVLVGTAAFVLKLVGILIGINPFPSLQGTAEKQNEFFFKRDEPTHKINWLSQLVQSWQVTYKVYFS